MKGVTRRFNEGVKPALDRIDLDIERGEFVAIVGQSGAGKSTLLNVLGLLDSPDEGSYAIDGVETGDLTEPERDALRAQTFGFVFQDSFVLPAETVARNVALPLRMNGVEHTRQLAAVEQSLARFGLISKADRTAGTLSGGERQRVAFARAIVGNPSVLLADEPTGNLDSVNTERALSYLRELNANGISIIVITHSDEVARVAARRIRITDGRVADDKREAPLTELRTPMTEVGTEAGNLSDSPEHEASRAPNGRRGWRVAEALTALLLAPMRSLTILAAFVVAVGGLVTAVNMTATAADQVSATLSAAALDAVIVQLPGLDSLEPAAARVRPLDGVEAVGVVVSIAAADAQVRRPIDGISQSVRLDVRAIDTGFLDVNGVEVWPAHARELMSEEDGTPTVLLGEESAEKLGIPNDRVGDVVTVAGQRAVVAGFIRSAERDPTLPQAVLISLADFVPPADATTGLTVRTAPGLPAKIAEALPLVIDPAAPENVQVQTVADLRELTKGVNGDLAVSVLLVSAVLLVLVCLTSSISMFLTILSRTREISLRRAVGATRGDIRVLFLLEGALLGASGGVAGAAIGIAVTTVVSTSLGWAPSFDSLGALVAVLASVVAGASSAIVPARRAAKVEPALALRAG
ncbi:MAG: ABC transporter ATP-binding protein/permease [Pseudoclavibacter sp.]